MTAAAPTAPPRARLERVEVRGLLKQYPGVVALDGANVTIEGGSVLGLLGKNGAGKSTLIKLLAGVVQPDAGEMVLDGEPITLHDPHAATALGFSFVHQELADVPNLSVAENVGLGLGYPTYPGGIVKRRVLKRNARTVLDRLEADIDPSTPLSRLSIAQRRLVMIAHGLAANAGLFVLDEPTASLTDDEIAHLHRVLRTLRDEGVAIVYVSHRLDEIFAVTDRVTVMRDGRDVFHGETSALDKQQLIEHITGTHVVAPEQRRRRVSPQGTEEVLRVEGMSQPGIVHDASFSLRAGELLGIAGLVGAGRTELMRLVSGADRAAAGRVTVRGQERRIRSPHDGMAAGIVLLPEDRKTQGAVMNFSVRKNITLPAMSRYRVAPPLPLPNQRRERAAALDLVGRLNIKVADVEQPALNLSGGNQQKVVLAKWLDSGADVYIFDEPTHGIDVEGKEEVYDLMAKLADQGRGVIFISSEFTELVGVCNRVLVMRDGRLVKEFEGEAISDAALVASCYSH
ncbi:sugar ABC transporter ATP-binding protein [Conexibacter sp. CPCC 206217]|uniref:sugar ABC transporter ATP-binding protein n=1 Tax=Conexibacter sp. CPCC 206217 TaxID=3064574 RepID=UPI002721A4FC|nr:sugar ABC transporter ATP-binding protein [Conexibacter sp. CPCC 206217]MDO8212405.1 sugar ABC transporter ATP-binding protein [Conexibacter sp. CPCC 206217]